MGGWPVPKRMRHLSRNSSSITSRLTRDVSGSKMIGAHSASEHERPLTAQLAATPLTRRVPSRDGPRRVTSRVLLERPRGIRRSTARAVALKRSASPGENIDHVAQQLEALVARPLEAVAPDDGAERASVAQPAHLLEDLVGALRRAGSSTPPPPGRAPWPPRSAGGAPRTWCSARRSPGRW